jgi:pyrroloquinoline quinone (PQQ) biosynthesis protein C
MTFDGEAFVDEMREELRASGRTLDQADWVKRTEQGEATKEDLVAWARQHYHGVTYHTRRVLSAWVTRVPYEMTDGIIDNLAEEVLGTTSKSGFGHLHWLFEFTRALGAPDEVITDATPNIDAMACSSFLYRLALQEPWHEVMFGGVLAIENQIPPAYIKVVKDFKTTTPTSCSPTTTRSTPSTSPSTRITVGTSVSSPNSTSTPTPSADRRGALTSPVQS